MCKPQSEQAFVVCVRFIVLHVWVSSGTDSLGWLGRCRTIDELLVGESFISLAHVEILALRHASIDLMVWYCDDGGGRR